MIGVITPLRKYKLLHFCQYGQNLAIHLRRADDHLVLFGKRKDFGSITSYQLWKTRKLFLL
jgi:hypothetical protein